MTNVTVTVMNFLIPTYGLFMEPVLCSSLILSGSFVLFLLSLNVLIKVLMVFL